MSARWELGSLMHWTAPDAPASPWPWPASARLVGSGRDALKLAVQAGGWKRLWVPSFFCQEVVAALVGLVPMSVYPDSPLQPASTPDFAEPGDGVLLVNYFGLRAAAPTWPEGVGRLEDHTHAPSSPWAAASTADFCVASLRKVHPLPDGGVVWSPAGSDLPAPAPTHPALQQASAWKLQGMVLKGRYLAGDAVAKPVFRGLLAQGEEALGYEQPCAMTAFSREVLGALPVHAWDRRRRDNHRWLVEQLQGGAFSTLLPESGADPFCVPLLFEDPADRDAALSALVRARVYPSTLWPLGEPVLPGVPPEHERLGRRLLCLPCDHRLLQEDRSRVLAAFVEGGLLP